MPLLPYLSGGCYEHVVRAEGIGSDGISTYEPNLKKAGIPVVDQLDEAAFGPMPPDTKKKPPLRRSQGWENWKR